MDRNRQTGLRVPEFKFWKQSQDVSDTSEKHSFSQRVASDCHVTKKSGKMGTATSSNAMDCQQQYSTAHYVLFTRMQPTTNYVGCTVVLGSHMGFSFFFDGLWSTENSIWTGPSRRNTENGKKILIFPNGLWRCYSMGSLKFLRGEGVVAPRSTTDSTEHRV